MREELCQTCAFEGAPVNSARCSSCIVPAEDPDDVVYSKWEDAWNEARTDVVSQNGNEGLHYQEGRNSIPIRPAPSALDTQVAGGHYKNLKIQPVEFIHANGLGFLEGCIIKRICRWRNKDGIQDLEKIKHEVDLLIELERRKK